MVAIPNVLDSSNVSLTYQRWRELFRWIKSLKYPPHDILRKLAERKWVLGTFHNQIIRYDITRTTQTSYSRFHVFPRSQDILIKMGVGTILAEWYNFLPLPTFLGRHMKEGPPRKINFTIQNTNIWFELTTWMSRHCWAMEATGKPHFIMYISHWAR